MRGLTQRLEDARSYRGAWLRPSNFESFWETSVTFAQNAHVESAVELPSATQAATFKRITFTSTDQTQLRARVILPASMSVAEPLASAELLAPAEPLASAELPAVVLFSDLGRGVRSWLHLLRFSALGMPVVALEARPCEASLKDAWRGALTAEELARALINPDDAASSTLKQLIDDALVTTAVASRFLGRTTVTWGEGLGGSQALFAAALLPKVAIATMALNPLFADNATTLRTVVGCGDTPQSDAAIDAVGLLDSACAAELVRVPALIGTALLDQSAPTEGTFALYNRLPGQKEMRVYPKYGHERINQFENEQINYLCEVISGLCHN
ncbi:MAG: acetylxylan esterase [Lancefieldella parvula]|uniref:Acetylxylan esterase n=1 Tax=Lancefieldella parvula TaxID=1382 RepID=A0A9E7AP19_9ACTN|nr:acetylxylan esterase [Atopobium sp.]UQF77677.1 MAG: acetylxylan esterase [Lancefieldella parvula]